MTATGQHKFSLYLLPLTAATAQKKTVTEDGFVQAIQSQQMIKDNNKGLLAELVHIEQDLREKLQVQEEKQQELEHVRQEENRQRWKSLCFLILNQRTAKPWVTSYYKNIPMHIYCLPIESVNPQIRKKKKKKKGCT